MSAKTVPVIGKPGPDEFPIAYAGYIGKVLSVGPLTSLEAQRADIKRFATLNHEKGAFRYADGKWSVKEVLGHISDAERVFAYRLLRIARADTTPLAGFDENQWAANAPHHHRPLRDVVHELLAVRDATLALVRSLDEAALGRSALANNKPVSARALCWILAGHGQHHLMILHDRYGIRDLWGATVQPSWEPGVLGG